MMTNDRLIQQIERAIRAGRVVTVGELTICYLKRNQEFSDEQGNHFRALASGVFQRMNVFSRFLEKPVGTKWVFSVPLDDLDVVLQRELDRFTDRQRDELSVDLAFAAGIAEMRADRAASRERSPAVSQDCDTPYSPSI